MAKEKDYDYSFSPSKLGVMECPRCFYDVEVNGIPQPRGIFPGLPGGVDRVMKEIRDMKREVLPNQLQGKINGKFYGDVAYITRLRNWASGLQTKLTIRGKIVRVIGALDDLIEEADSTFSPYDDKTKGDLPKNDGAQYYQTQVDVYALLLRDNKMTPSGKAYLNYHYPITMSGDEIVFGHALYTLKASPDGAIAKITQAVDLILGARPLSNPKCEFCQHAGRHFALVLKEQKDRAQAAVA